MPPIEDIVQWIKDKGITPDNGNDEKSILSMAWAIAIKQRDFGNQVHRKDRPAIPLQLILDESFEEVKTEMGFKVAAAEAARLTKVFLNVPNTKVKKR